jgi:predicted phosphodiesterase
VKVGVFADAHAHADALEAVLAAASGVDELWSLGDMVGTGPDPRHVVSRTRELCRVALLGNHDYLALRDGEANPSIEHARAALDEDALAWMRSRKPAANVYAADDEIGAREGEPPGESSQRREPAGRVVAQMWHGGPHNAVHEFVGPRNAPACLERQRAPLGLVGHTHVPAAFHDGTRRVRIARGEPLDISQGKWLLNPGAVFSPTGSALWLLLDLEARTATWMAAAFDPAPAVERARQLGFAL